MKQMNWFRRALSGALTAVTLLNTVLAPLPALAAEGRPEDDLAVYVDTLPQMEEVANQLDPAELVSAEAYTVEAGSEVNLATDFTNISYDGEKVKVSFYEAKNGEGQDFSTAHADSYKATYYAEPYSGNPAYRFNRTVTVMEPVAVEEDTPSANTTEEATEDSESASGDEDPDADLLPEMTETDDELDEAVLTDEEKAALEIAEESIVGAPADATIDEETGMIADPDDGADAPTPIVPLPEEDMVVVSEEEMSIMLEEAENQVTTDWETGMTVSGVLIWASEKEKINLLGMDSGESVSFRMPMLQSATTASTEYVSITKGDNYYYETYGLGSYVTSPYYIVFGNVSAVAFCVQPALPGPGDGVYTIERVWDNADLAKVIYYGTDASGRDNFYDNYYPGYSTVVRFIITHIAASYANGSSDAFTGANGTAQELAMQLYYYAVSQPEIPDMAMSFSNPSVTAYKDGDIQRTENVTFNADSSQSIVMNLPDGVVFHNVTTGAVSNPGASVTVVGGTTFYLSAPLSQTGDSGGSWSSTMRGSILEDYAAYKITTGWDVQDLAFVFGESSQHEQTVSFSVSWLSLARIYITKTDEASGKNLAGAVFGVYSDPGCTNLIVQMPATDANGSSSVDITATQDTVYLKEITPPKGYAYTASALNVSVVAGQDSSLTITNKEIKGSLTIYKEGEVLTGATVTETDVTFYYENRRLPGASYRVSAAEDIIAADGTVVYLQGEVVADNLVTGSDGSVTLSDLHLGTYAVTEISAPKNYINEGMTKKTTLTSTDPSQEIVMDTVTFENERQRVIVTAEKKDKLTDAVIPGTTFGLFAGEEILNYTGELLVKPDTLIATATTGNDGTCSFRTDLPLNYSFYVKELTAPTGYKLNGNDTYSFTTSYTNEKEEAISFSHIFTNEEIRGSLTIYKEGEVLAGVNTSENGVTFQYEARRQPGATFSVYAGAEIKSSGGKVIYYKGDLVSENLVTGADGSVTLKDLFLGTYTVVETGAPRNFVTTGESKNITLTLEAASGEAVMGSVTFRNDRQKVSVVINKVDDSTKNPLPGGIYGLYAAETINSADGDALVQKDALIEKATTDADGTAVFKADLPLNASYYVKELQAPKKYVRNETDVFKFTDAYSEDTEPEIKFSYTFENERVNARIDLVKVDLETGAKTQGDSSLEGAVYGLYAREDIVHPDGNTGVIYEKDSQIATLTTDKNGKAFIENLYLGKYYIKELVPSEGYLLDATEYNLDCSDEGDLVQTVKRSVTSKEQVIKQPFQIIKAANNGKTDADLLSGVGFTAYLISSLTQNADGSYDCSHAEPVVIAEDGKTEIFTDGRGYALTIPMPYGKYLVRETTTPHNFSPVDDFIVTVSENNPNEPQVWRVLLDEEFSAKLKIVKKDDESKKPVLIADTEFKIYDLNNKKYVEQVTTYPETVVHKSYFTDANGYLILPNNLLPGHYRIEEVNAPEGYTLNTASVEVIIDCDAAYEMDNVSGDAIITVELENHPVKGRLEISKQGEALKGYGKDFLYEPRPLAGAEFAVYASEDIYTPDHQTDANGNRIVIYAKDSLVTTVTTDENGMAVVENLPLGSYNVKETKAPVGFVLSNQVQAVTFTYKDQKTPVIERSVEFVNDRQKVSISVEKQDAQNGNKVSGAVFGLYTKDAISVNGKVIVAADKLLQEATSDAQGLAIFHVDLPLGYQFYVKELKAPAGFVSSDEVLEFAPEYQGQIIPVVTLTAVKKNEPTRVSVTKSDITTGVELDGATLTILDKKGHVVERWTSERNKPHIIQYLTVGETYTLREEYAPYGYLKATDVTFTVQDTAEIQKVEMKDEVPTALLIVTKKGEFLDKVTVGATAKGYMEHIFEYVTGSLTEVTFEVYAAEDIKAADGVSANHYKKDELVGTITTDSTGVAALSNLPVGKYYVKEVSTAHGYVLDQELRYVDLSYRDQNTPVVSFDENWQNNRQRVTVHVQKIEKDSNKPLAGGVFGLFTAEDIKSATGKTLVKKDTIIELKSTDAEGKIVFVADLPVDGKFYVQEQYAPDGYVTGHEKKEFTFDYGNADQSEIVYEFVFENEPTTVAFSKLEITSEREIPGAHLELRDSKGNLIEEWVSSEMPHIIQKLTAGKEYSLTETKPADGYVTAEKVNFTVEDSYNLQRVEMKDDVTKVEITKTDITTGKELPGAKLTILDKDGKVVATWVSTDKSTYIEKLPIGDYTLCEESAPDGYLKAENVKFSVKDTGEIQKVEMKDSPIKTPENPETPKTGDLYKPLLWAGVGVLGAALLVTSIIMSKKRKYR